MKQKGFSLLEIILALSILGTIGIFTINILGDQIATRQKIAELNTDEHSLNAAMSRITKDIEGAYLINPKIASYLNLSNRSVIPQFYFKGGNLVFFTTAYRSYLSGSNQSNQANIRYYSTKNSSNSLKTNLIRVVDTDFVNSIEDDDVGLSVVLVHDLESFEVKFWNGSDFTTDWDTRSGDNVGFLPKMVQVHLGIYQTEQRSQVQTQKTDRKVNVLDTIIYLNHAAYQKESNAQAQGDYKWQ